ncbi:MAG: hypothetical protein AABY00_02040 [Nanoarchaeota archaeon]
MFKTEELEKCIEHSLLEQVTLNEQEQLPLFGNTSEQVMSALYNRLLIESKDPMLSIAMIAPLTEFYARIGAYVATVNREGTLYEVGCGLAIPSLAYAILTNKPVVAIDKSRRKIRKTRGLAEKLNTATLKLEVKNAISIIKGKTPWYSLRDYSLGKPTRKDTLLIVNPVDDDVDAALIESEAQHVIFVGGPGKLFGRHEVYTSPLSGKEDWVKWFGIQNIQPYLESKGWKDFLLSGEDSKFLMPNMALLHISRTNENIYKSSLSF